MQFLLLVAGMVFISSRVLLSFGKRHIHVLALSLQVDLEKVVNVSPLDREKEISSSFESTEKAGGKL